MPLPTADVHETVKPPPRRWRRWVVGGVVVAAAAATAAVAFWPDGSAKPTRFDTRLVERGALTITVTAVGKLQPLDEVIISSELSGIVRAVHVHANDEVTAGQVLAELDTQILTAQAQQSHAQVAAMDATLTQALVAAKGAEQTYRSDQTLVATGATSRASLDRTRTAYESAVAGVALAEAQLRQARASDEAAHTNLGKARVVSPIDGIVLERNVEPGQAVVSALQAATMFRVARDLSRMTVEVELDEADVGRIRPGQSADFTVAAFSDRLFEARVEKVDLAPLDAADVVTYGAELRLDNPDFALRPGMTATVAIETGTYDDALLVPNAALRFTPEGSALPAPEAREGRRVARVWTLVDDEPEPIEVVAVATDGRLTVIEGPLNVGEPVILGLTEVKSR
jgi:HlyD family secretion protein